MRLSFIAVIISTTVVLSFIQTAMAEWTEDQQLEAFFREEWEYGLRQNPVFATLLGDYRYNDQLPDVSIESIKTDQAHDLETLKKLQGINRSKLSETNRVSFDLYLLNTQQEIEGHRFPGHLAPINQMNGVQQSVPDMVPQLPFLNVRHYEDYVARLNRLPVVIDQTIERMKEGIRHKITPPKITLRDVTKQIQAQVVDKAENSVFYQPFAEFPEAVPEAERSRLQSAGKEAIEMRIVPAYSKLLEFWTKEYYPAARDSIGISALPEGEAWYAYLAKTSTTTDLTPKQIHEIGLKEVARIRAEMDQIIAQTGFKGSFEDFMHFLRSDPQFYYNSPDDLLAGYRDICKRIDPQLPKLFGRLPRTPYGVREIPAYAAPSQTTAFYNEGNLKAGRPGWYYANTYRLETRPKWEMEALSIHEAVPGHHLQISLAQEMDDVPEFRKFSSYTAFVEGWGLYSESLGPELGLYKDPYSKFGQLTYEMWRAVRLVVDTGMHVMGWDRQKAIDYFKANASKQEHDIIVEIDRYIVWPGQALAYKIGELKIKELRKFAEDQLSEQFNIREFHDVVLGSGAIPLSVLEENVKTYVAGRMEREK